ncbi:MAG: hypothetical protein KDA45_07760 [Planctomycetales bacterium]|nr:hypothetical protein [Planctomycetales bacterium]
MSEQEPIDLGGLIADAAEANDAATVEGIIRNGEFILFQQVDMESGEVEEDSDGNFSVVLAEVDDDLAVVCFSNAEAAKLFAHEIADDLPEGQELPSVTLDGNTLLDGLPEDCGLLLNPSTDTECYFPPGCFTEEWEEGDEPADCEEENEAGEK